MSNWVTLETSYAIAETSHPIGPLSVLISPSGQHAVEAGETFEISLTLNNQGTLGAVIDVYIDETSQAVGQWCANPYERLALEVGHSSEVRFKVTVPVQTLPGAYEYLIVVDAPNHYPEDTPLRYPAALQVLPPIKSAVNLNDATFALRPESRSDRPVTFNPGAPLNVQAIVHNRSNRVDQFRLEVMDLPQDWYQIIYPEGLGELGLVTAADHMALNPGVKGIIQVVATCPTHVLAGRYLATMRLYSANEPDLVLMDVLYLETPPIYNLGVRAEAIIRKVKRKPALFHLHIPNIGNTAREITLQAQEDREDPLFTYQIEPSQIRIPSMTTALATLTASPAGMRRRAWIGRGRQVTFRLVTEDHHSLPAPEAAIAEILWERRPWWHLALVILLGVGIFGAIAGLFWYLFLRPPAPPKVLDFGSAASTYYQQQNDFVRLTWRIENPKRIQSLELRSEASQGAISTQPITFDLNNGVPPELSDYCVLDKILSCRNVFTSARQPGNYRFTLTILPKDDKASSIVAETSPIQILPTPSPKILTFGATQPRYWETLSSTDRKADAGTNSPSSPTVALNWQITSPEQISVLTLVGRLADGSILAPAKQYDLTEGLPKGLEEFCTLTSTDLTCSALPTEARTVGAYSFELRLFTPNNPEPIATAKTDPVRIVPLPVMIETFTVNGDIASTKYQLQISPEEDAAQTTVQIAWRVVGGSYTQVELLPTPGSVPMAGSLSYPLTTNTQEVVTLRVTSVSGDQITRSVILEALQPEISPPPTPPQSEPLLPAPPTPPASSSIPESLTTTAEEPRSPALLQPPAKPLTPRPSKPETPPITGDQPQK